MVKTLLTGWLAVSVSLAQTPPVRQIGLGTGLSVTAARYEGISQLIQRGKAFPLQLYFLSQGSRSRHYLQLQSAMYTDGLTSRYGGSITELMTGHMQYAYHHALSKSGPWTAWLGAVVNLQATLPGFTAQVGGNRFRNSQSPALLNTLNASAFLSWSLGRGRLEGQAWVSVGGYTIRPSYAYAYPDADDFKTWLGQAKAETWPLFGQFNARLAYNGYLSPHFRFRFDYQWQYGRAKRPRYTGLLTNQFLTSIAYQF